MRMPSLLLCLALLGACGDRRSFDERYEDTSSELEQRARALDQNLQNELEPGEPGASRNGS